MKNNTVTHGTMLQRALPGGKYGFVGLVYVPEPDLFEEGIGYVLDTTREPVLWTDRILEKPEGYDSLGVANILTMPAWRGTNQPGTTVVRTMPMGRGEPGLIVYGANSMPIIEPASGADESLIYMSEQMLRVEDAPVDRTRGQSLGQVLSLSGLFTTPKAEPIYLPSLSTPARAHMMDIRNWRVALAEGQKTEDEFDAWIREDPDRYSLARVGQRDEDFLSYLRLMNDRGALEDHMDFRTEAEKQANDRAAREAVREMMSEPNNSGPSINA